MSQNDTSQNDSVLGASRTAGDGGSEDVMAAPVALAEGLTVARGKTQRASSVLWAPGFVLEGKGCSLRLRKYSCGLS